MPMKVVATIAAILMLAGCMYVPERDSDEDAQWILDCRALGGEPDWGTIEHESENYRTCVFTYPDLP